jgi:hypothetical protein
MLVFDGTPTTNTLIFFDCKKLGLNKKHWLVAADPRTGKTVKTVKIKRVFIISPGMIAVGVKAKNQAPKISLNPGDKSTPL